MDDSRWERMWDLFHRALEVPPNDRASFLDAECAGDKELREELDRLVIEHGQSSGILERHEALPMPDGDLTQDPLIGEQVGPYRIVKPLGEGGMGVVYEAEQEEPVRRRVALKVIRVGMDTEQVVARFDAERQALAMMNHPFIARVFDAGASDTGRPYFAMEIVDGVPITEYCDKQRLGTAQRLDLFLQVCSGLRHAHRKGIIHRDVKPSNLLVAQEDGVALPKIIDFGVAKATEHRLTETMAFTVHGEWIGTPEYMSPEQAGSTGDDIDTRTDVYSLGILLYELLAGALPFDARELREAGFDELRRRIREDEPSKPSTRIDTLSAEHSTEAARRRRTTVSTLRNQLSGDLDWITMKALEKDRERRYESVSDLAEDIERHLRDEPVLAGPPSATYRARKFFRRHTVGASFAALVGLFVLVLAGVMTVQAGRIARERDQVRREAETSRRVSEFLVELFEVSNPSEARGNSVTAREVLDKGAARIEQGLADQPEVRGRLLQTMGEVYRSLGLYSEAQPLLEQSLEIRRERLGPEHRDTLASLDRLGSLAYDREDYDTAVAYHREALKLRRSVLGDDSADTAASLNNLGAVLKDQAKFDEAGPILDEAVDIRRRLLGDEHEQTLISMFNRAQLIAAMGDGEEAMRLHLEVLERRRRVLGEDHPHTLQSMNDVGFLLMRQGKLDEAEAYFEVALASYRKVLGNDHRETLGTLGKLGELWSRQGRHEEALDIAVTVLEAHRRVFGPDAPATLISLNELGVANARQGKLAEAETYWTEALEINRRVRGNDHPETLTSINNMAWLRSRQGKLEEAEGFYHEAYDGRRKLLGEHHEQAIGSQVSLAGIVARNGRQQEADGLFSSALAAARTLPRPHAAHARTGAMYGSFLKNARRYRDAEPVLIEAYEVLVELSGADNRRTQGVARSLVELYEAWGRPGEAATWRNKLPQK